MTDNDIRIEQWAVVEDADPYVAPEMRRRYLRGQVFGHPNPRHADGKTVTTSRIINVDGRRVKTNSGSTYVLGEPDPAYVEFCRSINQTMDELNPIKVKA